MGYQHDQIAYISEHATNKSGDVSSWLLRHKGWFAWYYFQWDLSCLLGYAQYILIDIWTIYVNYFIYLQMS